MATNLVVNFLGNNKLSKTTTVIGRDLKTLGTTADRVGKTMSRALGAAGLGFGLAKLAGYLKEATKAAAADANSQKQLALALQNTLGVNNANVAGAEKYIQKLSNTVGILDDDLRPALATAVRATGSLTKGQDLLNVALDVSAGTGKDLVQVTKAIARAQQGQLGGLQRLIPGIKKGADVMGQLRKQFAGAAELAAETDPFKRVAVIFDNLKESVGQQLLPYIREFSKYLASPEGERTLKNVARVLVDIGSLFGKIIGFLVNNIALIKSLIVLYVGIKLGIFAMTTAMKAYDFATKLATISTKTLKLAIASTGIGLLVVAVASLATAWAEANSAQEDYYEQTPQSQAFYDALQQTGDATVEINEQLGQIWQDGVLIFDQAAWDAKIAAIQDKIKAANDNIVKTAEKFRDSVSLAFGVSGKDEFSFFNVDMVIEKLKRMVDAAKGFGQNLRRLVKQGAGQDVVNELIGMGPAQGNIVAKGLLKSGRLSEYLGLRGSLYGTGAGVARIANETPEKTYNININKANVSAADIIREIRKFEKQTGKMYFAN